MRKSIAIFGALLAGVSMTYHFGVKGTDKKESSPSVASKSSQASSRKIRKSARINIEAKGAQETLLELEEQELNRILSGMWRDNPDEVFDFFDKIDSHNSYNVSRNIKLWSFLKYNFMDGLTGGSVEKKLAKLLEGSVGLTLENFGDFQLILDVSRIGEFKKTARDLSLSYKIDSLSAWEIEMILAREGESRAASQIVGEVARFRPVESLAAVSNSDPDTVHHVISAAASGFNSLLPSQALKLIETNRENPVYQEFSGHFFEGWILRDPQAAGEALNAMLKSPAKDQAAVAAIKYFIDGGDIERAETWIGQISSRELQGEIVNKFFSDSTE